MSAQDQSSDGDGVDGGGTSAAEDQVLFEVTSDSTHDDRVRAVRLHRRTLIVVYAFAGAGLLAGAVLGRDWWWAVLAVWFLAANWWMPWLVLRKHPRGPVTVVTTIREGSFTRSNSLGELTTYSWHDVANVRGRSGLLLLRMRGLTVPIRWRDLTEEQQRELIDLLERRGVPIEGDLAPT